MTNYLFAALSAWILCSCGPQKNQTISNNTEDETQTDSAKFEQYFQWTETVEYFNSYEYDSSVLQKIEKNRDTLMLLDFLTSNYNSVKLYEDFPYSPNDLVESIYAIDFNGDSLLDIIYQGPTGGENFITQFFLNNGDHYEKVFSGFQQITRADFDNNRLNSFTLINPGCCADPQFAEYYYSVEYFHNKPTFKLEKTIGYLSQTEKPKTQLTNSKDFTIKSNNAKLRSDCYKLDNVEHPYYGPNGNSLAIYKAGSKGRALGTKKDKNEEWIFVIMNSDSSIDSCDFPTFKEQATELKGWILKSDTDLK